MTIYDELLKKKQGGSTPSKGVSTYDQLKSSQSDTPNRVLTTYDRIKASKIPTVPEPQKTFGDRISEFGTGVKNAIKSIPNVLGNVGNTVGKFAAKVDVAGAQLFADTVDYSADFLNNVIADQIKGKDYRVLDPFRVVGKEKRSELADKWKNFYNNNVGNQTEALKEVVGNLAKLPALQPSKEWSEASIQDKFSPKHLAETVMETGPGVIASIGSFVINPALGFTLSTGSVANEINELAQKAGVPEEKALSLGLGTGLLVGYLDKVVPEEILNPEEKQMFIGAIAKRMAFSGLKEAGTEMTQEGAQLLVESTLREDLKFDEIKTRVIMSGFGGFIGGAGMQGAVSFANNVKSGDIAAINQEDIKNPEVLAEVSPQLQEQMVTGTGDVTNVGEVAQGDTTKPVKSIETLPKVMSTDELLSHINERGGGFRTEEQVAALKESIVKFGITYPIELTVNEDGSFDIYDGNHRVQIAKDLGISELPVKVVQDNRVKTETQQLKAPDTKLSLPEGETKPQRTFVFNDVNNTTTIQEGQDVIGDNFTMTPKADKNKIEVARKLADYRYALERLNKNPTPATLERFRKARSVVNELKANNYVAIEPEVKKAKPKTQKTAVEQQVEPKIKKSQTEITAKPAEKTTESTQTKIEVKAEPEVVKVAPTQLPVGEGKQKVSKLQARMAGALKATPDQIEELGLQTYNQMTNADQIAKATDYVKNNPQEALKVITGEINPPQGILQNAVFKALTDAASTDVSLASQVATLAGTRFGQEIEILKTILADNPAVIMQDVVQARIEAYEQKTRKKISEVKKSDLKDIQSEIRKPNKADWRSFVESIQC